MYVYVCVLSVFTLQMCTKAWYRNTVCPAAARSSSTRRTCITTDTPTRHHSGTGTQSCGP